MKLNEPTLLSTFRRTVGGHGAAGEALTPLLAALDSELPWAFAMTSMGHLHITTAPYGRLELDRLGFVLFAWTGGPTYRASLIPPGLRHAIDELEGPLEPVAARVFEWTERLRDGFSRHALDEPTDDTNGQRPKFSPGTPVRVLARGGRNTEREGKVRHAEWHRKHRRWMYYLEVAGEPLSKRYYGVDLSRIE